jgi:hypothetical protein
MTIHNEDGNNKQSPIYSWASASVTAAGTVAATNLTGVTGFTTLLSNFTDEGRKPHKISVEASGAAYLKINGGDVITLGATSPFEAEDLVINSLGISTGGDARTITVYLQ